nr:MAG TPA: minor capsid protein [Caudoviricetes sp.]
MARLDKLTALRLSEPVEDAYLECIDRLIANIAKHLGTGKAFRTADWEVRKLAELGQLTAENARIINEATKRVPMEIRLALEQSSAIALRDLESLIDKAIKAGAIEQAPVDSTIELVETIMSRAIEQANITNTTLLESARGAYLRAVNDLVQWEEFSIGAIGQKYIADAMNQGAIAVVTGTETRTQALKKAISQLADRGLYGLVDRAGRHWSPEAYMGMVIRTTSHNTAIDSVRAKQQDYNSDIFQVSQHPGARPLCYPYQGKFYSWSGASGTFTDGNGVQHRYSGIQSTSYGKPAGLFGINCGHYPLPQIPKVTIPQDKPEQDKEENDRLYRESQQQRAYERDIRNAKRKREAFAEAGLDDAAKEQEAVIRARQERMREFVKQTGRTRRYDREQIK